MLELRTHVPENMSLPLKEFMWQQQRERNGILQKQTKKGGYDVVYVGCPYLGLWWD